MNKTMAMLPLAALAALAALAGGWAQAGPAEPMLAGNAAGVGISVLGTPHPPDKPEDWTMQDCSTKTQFSWPPQNPDDNVKPGYCVVVVNVQTLPGGGCRVTTDTPGVIFIAPGTQRIFWRLRLGDVRTYRFQPTGITVRRAAINFRGESFPQDTDRRFFAVTRLTSENRVYAYDIQVERRSDGTPCTGYGPLIVNRG